MRANRRPQPRLGIIVPFDFPYDREYWRYTPDDVSLAITRTPHIAGPVDLEGVLKVGDEAMVAAATRSLIAVRPAAVAYACTSGSFVRGREGERRLIAAMRGAGAPAAITTRGAAAAALQSLGVRRVAVAAPYVGEIADRLVSFLADSGIEAVSCEYLGLDESAEVVESAQVIDLALRADRPDAEAVFVACTNLETFDVIPDLESRLTKPVLTANQVTMWGVLRAAGIALPAVNQRLFGRIVAANHRTSA